MPNVILKTKQEQKEFRELLSEALTEVAFTIGAKEAKIGNVIENSNRTGLSVRLQFIFDK